MWDDPRQRCEDLLERGRTVEAEQVAREALALNGQLFGLRSDIAGRCYETLGLIFLVSGRPSEAIEPLSTALRICQDDPLRAADALDLLGEAYERAGRERPAERAFKKGLKLRELAFGPRDADVAKSLMHLAHLESARHHNEAAEQLLIRAREIFEDKPERLEELCAALHQLGAVYLAEGKLIDANRTFERVLRLRIARTGTTDPAVADAMRDLAISWARSGDLGGAEVLLRRAIELKRKVVESDHPALTLMERQLRDVVRSEAAAQ